MVRSHRPVRQDLASCLRYEAAPRTYQAIARRATVADFKSVQRLQLGEAPQLEKVNEAGEFKRGSIGEAKETYRVETYGKVVGITRQVLINDDLDAFTRVPSLFGMICICGFMPA